MFKRFLYSGPTIFACSRKQGSSDKVSSPSASSKHGFSMGLKLVSNIKEEKSYIFIMFRINKCQHVMPVSYLS